jgi:hypothetical protein
MREEYSYLGVTTTIAHLCCIVMSVQNAASARPSSSGGDDLDDQKGDRSRDIERFY